MKKQGKPKRKFELWEEDPESYFASIENPHERRLIRFALQIKNEPLTATERIFATLKEIMEIYYEERRAKEREEEAAAR